MTPTPDIAAENNSPTKTWLGSLSSVLAIIALIGTFFTLLGFGAALSLETFGLNPAAVYSSPFDFLVLSSDVLLQLFNKLHTAFANSAAHHFWYFRVAPVFGVIAFIAFIAYLWLRKGTSRRGHQYVSKFLLPMRQFSAFMWSQSWVKLPLVTLTAWIAAASLLRIFLVFFLTLIILPMIPSCMGYTAGKGFITKYVINPSQCAPLYSQKDRMRSPSVSPPNSDETPAAALCLRVSKDGKELGRGRKIERTQDTVFLFKPLTGEVLSIPIKDAIVEQIEKL